MADTKIKSLLNEALTTLAHRDFSSSQRLAAQVLKLNSDPSIAAQARRLLALSGTLLAGESRDLYAVLRLSRADSFDSDLVWTRYVELAETLANPELNDVAFAQEAYDLTFHAFSVLSDPDKKRQYDDAASPPPPPSFWTVCPYCFWLFQYGKEYEECCLRCQNCSRAFQGVAVGDLPPEVVVQGKDQYFATFCVVPLTYNVKESVGLGGEQKVEVSNGGADIEEGLSGMRVVKAKARRQMMNVKSVAVKKKNRNLSEFEEMEIEIENGKKSDDGELLFYEGVDDDDDDLYVGLEDMNVTL